jgi:O-antigen ligase
MSITAICLVCIFACLVAILQYITIYFHLTHKALVYIIPPVEKFAFFKMEQNVSTSGLRLPSFFFHSNQFGHFLAVCFAILFPLLLYSKNALHRWFLTFVIVLLISCTFITQSRASIFLIGIAAVSVLLLNANIAGKKWKTLLLLLVGGITVGAVVFALNAESYLERLATFDLSFREKNWLYAIKLIPANFLFGVGPGVASYNIMLNFPLIEESMAINSYVALGTVDYRASHPHNFYLATLLETGVFLLVAKLIFYGFLFKLSFSIVTRAKHALVRALASSTLTVLIIEFIRGFFESYCFLTAMESGGLVAFVISMLLYLDSKANRHPMSSLSYSKTRESSDAMANTYIDVKQDAK